MSDTLTFTDMTFGYFYNTGFTDGPKFSIISVGQSYNIF